MTVSLSSSDRWVVLVDEIKGFQIDLMFFKHFARINVEKITVLRMTKTSPAN